MKERTPGPVAAARIARIAVLLGLMAASPAGAQILNTLRGFEDGAPGWSGEVGAFLSATGGNTENTSLTGAGSVQHQGKVHRWRLLLDGTRERSAGSTTEESSAIHLRHNARLSERFASIAFVQHQYDRFQRLDSRFLFGAGARWDLVRQERIQASLGVSPMLEVERNEGEGVRSHGRLSTFVSVFGRLDERTRVDLTAFVQPALEEISDVRAVGISSLRVAIGAGVSLLVHARVQYDAEPPAGVERTDWKLKTGLSLEL